LQIGAAICIGGGCLIVVFSRNRVSPAAIRQRTRLLALAALLLAGGALLSFLSANVA
jgi:hypothetical protein